MPIQIADNLAFPADAVTQTLAAIGRKGAGKTYLATMIAEQMLDAGAQVVIIDPVGNWYGLRLAADGRSQGKAIFVLGGDHGDVPLTPDAGARIARFIVETGASVVLDISGFRIGERKRFAWEFGEELLHLKKKHRTAMHLFIEEAQLLIPQRVGRDEARMVGAYEHIVRLGRNYGIGCTLITQRPQSVNKEALNQVECLCVLQVTGPQERKALEDWVQEVGGQRELVGELPGLRQGEGYVWSPAWLRTYRRVRFAKKTTFDASATPEVGAAAKPVTLSAMDVETLRSSLKDVIERAEADDPAALRKRIADLEEELETNRKDHLRTLQVDSTRRNRERQAGFTEGFQNGVARGREEAYKEIGEALPGLEHYCNGAIDRVGKIFEHVAWLRGKLVETQTTMIVEIKDEAAFESAFGAADQSGTKLVPIPEQANDVLAADFHREYDRAEHDPALKAAHEIARASAPAPKGDLGKAERAVLSAAAFFDPKPASRVQLAVLAGYSASSGHFANILGALRSKGLIEGRGDDNRITAAGRKCGPFNPPLRGNALRKFWLEHLGKAESAVLAVLMKYYPRSVNRQTLAREAGYSADSGHFANVLGRLRSLELATGRGDENKASEALFV